MGPSGRVRRRQLVHTGCLVVAAFAGCAGDSGDGEQVTSTATPTAVALTAPMNAGMDQYGTAAQRFEAQLDRLAGSPGDIRIDEIRDLIEAGTADLEAAKADASPEQQAAIDVFLTVGEWLGALADALATYRSGLEAVVDGRDAFLASQYDRAIEQFETAGARMQGVSDSLADASTVYDRIDVGPLEPVDDIDAAEFRAQLGAFRERARGLDAFSTAMRVYARAAGTLADGRRRYDAGHAAGDADEFKRAISAFEAARASFEEARATLRQGAEAAPAPLQDRFRQLECYVGEYRAAADHMADAARAAEAGNTEAAMTAYEQAMAAEEAADEC